MTLYQIWILQESGACLFHQKYIDFKNDENLISGFLSAVNSFIGSFNAEIKWIETNRFRFVFNREESMIFVACTSLADRSETTYKRLARVSKHFMIMFKNELKKTEQAIPVDIFKKISPTVNRIFALPETAGKVEIFDTNQCINSSSFDFATPESRLMSLIRYKRKISFQELTTHLKLTEEQVQSTIKKLENKRFIKRTTLSDGSERYNLIPAERFSS